METSLQCRMFFYFVYEFFLSSYIYFSKQSQGNCSTGEHTFFSKYRISVYCSFREKAMGRNIMTGGLWNLSCWKIFKLSPGYVHCAVSECQINLLMKRADYFCRYKPLCLQVCPFSSKRKTRNNKEFKFAFWCIARP